MKTINYYDGKKIIKIEVSDDIVQGYQEIKREEWRQEYHIRKNHISSDALTDAGYQFEDECSNLQGNIEQAEDASELALKCDAMKKILKTLAPMQQQIIYLKFFQSKNDTEIS